MYYGELENREFSCFYQEVNNFNPGRYTCPHVPKYGSNYVFGENVSVLSEPIRSSDRYKQCLDCSVDIGALPPTNKPTN